MRLRTQIISGYVGLALLIAAVGAVGFLSVRSIADRLDDAINRTQPVLTALQGIRLHATATALERFAPHAFDDEPDRRRERDEDAAEKDTGGARGAETTGHRTATASPPVRQGPRDRLLAAIEEHRRLVDAYFPDEIKDAEEIRRRAEVMLDRIATSGPKQPAAIGQALDALLDVVDDAAAGEANEFREMQEHAGEQAAAHLNTVLAAAFLALSLAILGALLLTRRIAGPLTALGESAAAWGRGQLDARVDDRGADELADLARAFNRMAGQLSLSLVSRDYVESIIESLADGLLIVDAQGRIERSNAAMRRMLADSSADALVGRAVETVFYTAAGEAVFYTAAGEAVTIERIAAGGIDCGLTDADACDPKTVVALAAGALSGASGAHSRVLLVRDITTRKHDEERLHFLASYDPLTGLPNRRVFLDHLRASTARLPWNKKHAGILFCDLDRFKAVNDSLGHAIGDVLLQRVSERIRDCLRPGDVVGRWAGDEFVVLLDDLADPDDALRVAGHIVGRFGEPMQVGPHELFASLSIGVALATADAEDADELVMNADLAMYAAKSGGRNQVIAYRSEMRERTQLRLKLEHALRAAIDDDDQLLVHYQPQESFAGKLIGFEALVRWQHPELGLISPAQFLPTAEEAGLMAALDERVLRIACAELKRWHESGWPGVHVAVNLSDQSFARPDLVDAVRRTLADTGVPPQALELELTEQIVMENVGSAVDTMNALRALGPTLSIDDFGTGYSSLAHLKRCPIGLLKIDRSFVTDVTRDASDQAITFAIIALAHKLGIEVIAEGVETAEQLAILRGNGCDAYQGYLLSKPLPADEVGRWLARRPAPR